MGSMINYIASLAAGNAVQVFLDIPKDATRCRVLRKRADTIAAADDPGSNVVFDGLDGQFIDTTALVNGTEYFYRPFYLVDGAWVPAPSRAITPAAEFADLSPDALELVQERLQLGFQVFVARGVLDHHVPVLLATPDYEGCSFPFVSVHMAATGPADRFLGEMIAPGGIGMDGMFESTEGWLARHQILVIVWSKNGDERNVMRKALNAIVTLNLPVLEAKGLSLIDPQYGDVDDMNTYPAPIYQTTCTLTCTAPAAVETRSQVATDVKAELLFQS